MKSILSCVLARQSLQTQNALICLRLPDKEVLNSLFNFEDSVCSAFRTLVASNWIFLVFSLFLSSTFFHMIMVRMCTTTTYTHTWAPAEATVCDAVKMLLFLLSSILQPLHYHLWKNVPACLAVSALTVNNSATGWSASVTFDTHTWISETP